MSTNQTMSHFSTRDNVAERAFLLTIGNLHYALLQREWFENRHGDLDIVVSSDHWPRLVEAIKQFSHENNYPIVKAYELAKAIVCIVLLTGSARIHLDICIVPCRRRSFGVNLRKGLASRELKDGIYVLDERNASVYRRIKRLYKKIPFVMSLAKIPNLAVLLRRIAKTTLFLRGGLLHIPYLQDLSVLQSEAVIIKTHDYLNLELLPKYSNIEEATNSDKN